MNNVDIVTAFIMGLAGAGHCLAMCGGIASAIGVQTRWSNIVLYNVGRMASYVLLGAIVGGAVALIAPDSPHTTKVLRWLAVLFLLALGLYFTGWWPILNKLEQAAKPLWNRVKGLAPAQTGGGLTVFLAGAVWGWLPCGLVYSALSYAAVSGDAAWWPVNGGVCDRYVSGDGWRRLLQSGHAQYFTGTRLPPGHRCVTDDLRAVDRTDADSSAFLIDRLGTSFYLR